jgi:hypothetical protein
VNIEEEILQISRTVSRIEGRFDAMQNLPERISKLEQCQSWLKGGWVFLLAIFGYALRAIYGK